MPNGLFTAEGIWFHTSVRDLREFAGPVLDREPLSSLIEQATAWFRSPGTLALWVVLVALPARSPWVSVLLGVVAFAGWTLLSPGLIFRPLARVMAFLQHPFVAGFAYVGVLSYLGTTGQTSAVIAGLAWFVLVRWGVLQRTLSALLEPGLKSLYGLPAADQVLRGVIIRAALKHRVGVGDLDAMEQRMLEIANRHRK